MHIKHWISGLAITGLMSGATGCAGITPHHARTSHRSLDEVLAASEPNVWVLLHRQSDKDEVRFTRQRHGGSAFDSKRERLILYGSDTHDKLPDPSPKTPDGVDWKNNPYFFDTATLTWSTPYPEDAWETYRVNDEGLPVAGVGVERPWAMHTFGGLIYDSARDELVVCSWPGHMNPGRFTDVLEHVWDEVKKHPTWTYSLETGIWRALDGDPVHFFPYAAAYDSDRNVILGYRNSGVWELRGEPREWSRVARGSKLSWGNNAVYDAKHKALVVFGSHRRTNSIVAYWPENEKHVTLPTPGPRPPSSVYVPMSFDPSIGQTVIVADTRAPESEGGQRTGSAETWLYDLGKDQWTHLPQAALPFPMGMNYNLEHDPGRGVNLLVACMPDDEGNLETAVFALRIDLKKLHPTTPE